MSMMINMEARFSIYREDDMTGQWKIKRLGRAANGQWMYLARDPENRPHSIRAGSIEEVRAWIWTKFPGADVGVGKRKVVSRYEI